jgi:hypothetical protein
MQFTPEPTWCNVVSKLVGCYEAELNPTWETLLATRFDTIVDVGCADGYYAIGLAMRQPSATLWAFDIDPACRRVTSALAAVNGLSERVRVRGRCSPRELRRVMRGRTLVLSDCEGYEIVLIDPEAIPQLAHAAMVIELHDEASPGVYQTLLNRMSATHDCVRIDNQPRCASAFRELSIFSDADADRLLREVRPGGNNWLVVMPHSAG